MELSLGDIQLILGEIEREENQLRKRKEFKSFQIYDGNLKSYVQSRIKEMYPKTWQAYTISDYSILKKIVDKKSKAYKEAPIRKADSETANLKYQDIADNSSLNSAMQNLDRYFNQHKYGMISSFMELSNDGTPVFDFMPLAPYEFDCIKDDKGNLKVVILSYPSSNITIGSDGDGVDTLIAGPSADEGSNSKLYAFWTDTNHYVVRISIGSDGKRKGIPEILAFPDNPNNINPWGYLPFVYIPENDGANYPVASPLADQTVELNALLSVYLTSGNMQVGQLVLKYPQDQDIQMVTHGLMTGIKLPQSKDPDSGETTAEYISPAPNMDGHRTSIMTFLNLILDEQGIKPASGTDITAEKFASGLDRMISESDVQDIIESNQTIYSQVEKNLFAIVKAQLDSINDRSIGDEKLQVIYRKPKMLITDTERLNNLKTMIDLGLLEEWEKFTYIDPNMTEEQAKEKLARIQQADSDRMSSLVEASNGVEPNADITGPSNEGS